LSFISGSKPIIEATVGGGIAVEEKGGAVFAITKVVRPFKIEAEIRPRGRIECERHAQLKLFPCIGHLDVTNGFPAFIKRGLPSLNQYTAKV
jgi:hypothetical protein